MTCSVNKIQVLQWSYANYTMYSQNKFPFQPHNIGPISTWVTFSQIHFKTCTLKAWVRIKFESGDTKKVEFLQHFSQ